MSAANSRSITQRALEPAAAVLDKIGQLVSLTGQTVVHWPQ